MTKQSQSVETLARAGYAARGVVYLLIGGLSLATALTQVRSEAAGAEDALSSLTGNPLTVALLGIIGVGLLCFAGWRAVQAVADTDCYGDDLKGLSARTGFIVSALFHVVLGLYALSLAFGLTTSSGSNGSSSEDAAAWLLAQPFGAIALGIIAVGILVAAIAQVRRSLNGTYKQELDVPSATMRKLAPLCVFAMVARAAVFLIIGALLLYAASTVDASRAVGLGNALVWLKSQSYGETLFLVTSAGLFAFGIYGLVQGRWRRVAAVHG